MLSERSSTPSFASRIVGTIREDVINFEEMTDEQLRSSLEEATRMSRALTLENEVFERYLRRRDPQCLHIPPTEGPIVIRGILSPPPHFPESSPAPYTQTLLHGHQNFLAERQTIYIVGCQKKNEIQDPSDPELSLIAESARQAQKIAGLRGSHPALAGRLDSSSTILSDRPRPSTASLSQQFTTRHTSGSQHLSIGGGMPRQRGAIAKGLKITIAHRIELADKEVEYMQKQCAEFERGSMKKKVELTTQSEEMKQRMNECIEAAEKFESEVLKGVDPARKKVPVEKLTRFIEDQIKLAAAIIDQLNLKIVTSKRLIRQTEKQIQQREELGKTIRPIDFEKLEIENEYIALENEKLSRRLTTQKHIMGHYNLTLKHRKDTLLERRSKLQALQKQMIERKHENVELRRYQARAARGLQKASDQLTTIKRLQEHYEAPAVEEFLELQKKLQEARQEHKRLARRRKIQLFSLRLNRKSN